MELLRKNFYRLIILFVFTIPIASFLSAKILVVLFLLSLLIVGGQIRRLVKSIDVFVYLIVLLFGLLYSSDLSTGFKVIETNFSFLAIPIVLCCIAPFDEKKRNDLFHSFALGLTLVSLIFLTNSLITYVNEGDFNVFFSYQLTSILSYHPTYLAYYLIFAITFGLYLLYDQKTSSHSNLVLLAILFFFFMLMLTGGLTSFISMLLVFSFFILKFLVGEKSGMKRLTFGLVGSMMICMFCASLISQDNRDAVLTDSWERFVLWESAIKATPDLIWGVGTGDYKNVLNDYYVTHNLKQFAVESYNSHNQFIQILFTNGILGLGTLLFLLGRLLYLSIKHHDVLGTLIFFPFLIYGMTEVFLGRYQGVVFFVLFQQVFISYYTSAKPVPASLKGI